ncbi:anti-sigma-F factor Fin family protein [Neobacillus sp. OS1-32]|uniref:Anti-sigma-F factor Fin family protein n=1 Tax=Neobacillus paridis TaxID=2803862 RepID=A0ABS1TSB2_9BACI|nr:anti-sigma-F factor Fin family protein [Neobacillus sp. OS1-32]MBL4954205.1 anti-sigma-F factor Fin family protein [Neobacillus paridis]WML29482.1 anti-sigma-F factor Fin family protein [Neobacillus sp. OS1-32]
MAIHYYCRHCGVKLGSIEQVSVHSEVLGLDKLTEQERQDMVIYEPSGDIQIRAICEDCQESLERNPDYHQYDFLIH